MAVTAGFNAPDFALVSKGADGPEIVRLSDFTGKNVVLLFFPMAFTGGCTKEFCEVSSGLKAYEDLNAVVLGVSGDNPFAQEAWAQKEGISVKLLSDYEHKVAEAYGVAYKTFLPEKNLTMGGVPKRSAFVIDKGGIVRYAEVHDNPAEMPDFVKIQETLKGLS
jgi:peroxiredoxin